MITSCDLPPVRTVPLAQIEANPNDPRYCLRDARHDALVESLRAAGQDEPISVYRIAEDRYRIRSGTQLWHAALDAGLETLRAEVHARTTRLEDLRRIIRSEELGRPRGAYERACLAGSMCEALEQEWGRRPSTRELAPHLNIQHVAASERIRVYDQVTFQVIAQSGITTEELVTLSHAALHRTSREDSEERAASLHHEARGRYPEWWQGGEVAMQRRLILQAREDGSLRLDIPRVDLLGAEQVADLLRTLAPLVEQLESRRSDAPSGEHARST